MVTTTNISQTTGTAGDGIPRKVKQVNFRMPVGEYRGLRRLIFDRCSVQEFVLTAVRERIAAEKRARKGTANATK